MDVVHLHLNGNGTKRIFLSFKEGIPFMNNKEKYLNMIRTITKHPIAVIA